MIQSRFIIIAGNIGVGKSSLTSQIASSLNWIPVYEPHDENPFLADFYKDMVRWSFHSQMFFLSKRLKLHHSITQTATSIIQDRSIYEDAEIFAHNLFLQNYMSENEWRTYKDLYNTLITMLKSPDLVVFLCASISTLQQRIKHRGREFEQGISLDYLKRLNDLYEDWVNTFNLCPILKINTDKLDFVNNHADLNIIIKQIKLRLKISKG